MRPQLLIALVLLLNACGPRTTVSTVIRNHSEPASVITGSWISAPFETQLGDATDEICFRVDGGVSTVLKSQGATLPLSGTYRVLSDRLLYSWSTGLKETAHFSVRNDALLITDESGKTRRYRRTSRRC